MKSLILTPFLLLLSACFDYNFYISNQTENCSPNCNGSLQNPFNNLIDAFTSLSERNTSIIHENSSITLNFLQKNNYITLLDFSKSSLNQDLYVINDSNYHIIIQGDPMNTPIMMTINTNNFFFLCTNIIEIKEMNFFFNFTSFIQCSLHNLFVFSSNSTLIIRNSSFEIIGSLTFPVSSFLYLASNYFMNINNVTLFLIFTNFTGKLYEYGILNIMSSSSNIFIKEIIITDFVENSNYLININGINNFMNIDILFLINCGNGINIAESNNVIIDHLSIYYHEIQNQLINCSNSINLTIRNFVVFNNPCSNILHGNFNNNIIIQNFYMNFSNGNCTNAIYFSFEMNNSIIFDTIILENLLNMTNGKIIYSNKGYNSFEITTAKLMNLIIDSPIELKNDNMIINNSIFYQIILTNQGSLISSIDSSILIHNSVFTNIRSINGYGAIINMTESSLELNQSIFKFNQAGILGGLFSAQTSKININMIYCFNTIAGGGVIIMLLDDSILNISNSKFDTIISQYFNGSIGFCGGAFLAFNRNQINIIDSILSNIPNSLNGEFMCLYNQNIVNLTNILSYEILSFVGALSFLMNNTAFLNNFTIITLSDIETIGIFIEYNNSLFIKSLKFLHFFTNSEYGGGIILKVQNTIEIHDSIIHDVLAFAGSGMMVFYDNIVLLFNVTFDSHVNRNGINYYGGMIYLKNNNQLNITNSIFSNATAINGGAGITVIGQNILFFDSCKFYNISLINNFRGQAGIIYLYFQNQLNVNKTYFMNSFGFFGCGIFVTEENNITIYNSFFINLTSSNQSSALGGWTLNNYTVINSVFINNKCYFSGGVFYIDLQNTAYFNKIICILSNAQDQGGIFYINQNNDVTINNSLFSESHSENNGGAIFLVLSNFLTISFSNITLSSTSDSGAGCIIYGQTSNILTFTNNYIYDIEITGDGGFIYLFLSNDMICLNSTFVNFKANKLSYFGAIIYCNTFSQIIFNNIIIRNVGGLFSGGIAYLGDWNEIIAKKLHIEHVNTYFGGSFLYAYQYNTITVDDSDLNDFVCTYFGIFYAYNNNSLVISNSNYTNIITLSYDGSIFQLFQFNLADLTNLYLSNVTCKGYGCFGDIIQFNLVMSYMIHMENIFSTTSSGDILYCETNNSVIVKQISINNKYYMKSTMTNLIYLSNLNYLEIQNVSIISQNCFGDGCFFMSYEANVIIIKNATFQKFNYFQDFSIFYLFELNNLTFFGVNLLVNVQENTFKCVVFLLISENTINISNVKYNLMNINTLYESSIYNTILITKERISKSSRISIYFQSGVNSHTVLKIIEPIFWFYTVYSIISCDNCSIIIEKGSIIVLNSLNTLFNFYSDSKVSFRKCSFINMFNANNRLLYVEDSSVNITKGFFFNLRQSGSQILIQNLKENEIFLSKNSNFHKNIASHIKGNQGSFINFQAINDIYSINKPPIITNLKITKNRFLFNTGYNGSSLYISFSHGLTEIDENYFIKGKAIFGGSIFVNKSFVLIKNNTFLQSKAVDFTNNGIYTKGGAIYLYQSFMNNIFLENNVFIENYADIAASVYDEDAYDLKVNNNSFLENKALFYGPNIITPFQTISFVDKDFLLMKNIPKMLIISGFAYNTCLFQISPIDTQGNIVIFSDIDLKSYINITQIEPNPSLYQNDISFGMNSGVLCFNGPFTRNQIPIQMSFLYEITYKSTILVFPLEFRDCVIGEYLTEYFECISCEIETFSFEQNFLMPFYCQTCKDSFPYECYGGDKVTPKPDYWRRDKFSTNFLRCLINGICIQVLDDTLDEFYTGACNLGYKGALCNICDVGYGKITKTLCRTCDWPYVLYKMLRLVLKTVYYVYIIYIGFRMLYSITLLSGVKKLVIAIGLLKNLIVHIQITSFLPQVPINWPPNFNIAASILFSFTPDVNDALYFECLVNESNLNIEPVYLPLIFCPIYILFVLVISIIVIRRMKNFKILLSELKDLKKYHIYVTIFRIMIFISFVDICSVYLQMNQCIDIGDNSQQDLRLYNNLEIDCKSEQHMFWITNFSIPFIVFCTFIIIVLIFRLVYYKKHNKLYNYDIKFRMGYYFFPYKKRFFYWDIVILLRKVLIAFVFFYFYDKIINKNLYPFLVIYLILSVFFLMQAYYSPYKYKYNILNRMELASLFIMSLNMLMLLFNLMNENKVLNDQNFNIGLIFMIFFSNIMYFLIWFCVYYKFYLKTKVKNLFNYQFSKENSPNKLCLSKIKEYLQENYYWINKKWFYFSKKHSKNNLARSKLFCEFLHETKNVPNLKLIKNQKNIDVFNQINNKDYLKIKKENQLEFFKEGNVLLKFDKFQRKHCFKSIFIQKVKNKSNFIDFLITYHIVLNTKVEIASSFKYGIHSMEGRLTIFLFILIDFLVGVIYFDFFLYLFGIFI